MQISVFEKAAKATFMQQVAKMQERAGVPGDILNAALPAKESGPYGTYAWLSDPPIMRKFLGESKGKELLSSKYQIYNEEYRGTVNAKIRDIEMDQVGAYMTMIRQMANRGYQLQRRMIAELMPNGITGLAYDGIAFFSNATGPRVNDNYLSGNGVDTLAHIQTDVEAVIAALATMKDTEGEDLNTVLTTIWCNPLHVFKFKKVVGSSSDPSQANPGVENALKDLGITVIGNPKLTGNSWIGGCTSDILKPFIIQERKPVEQVTDDTFRIAKKLIQVHADWDGGVGYGLPQLAVYVYNT